MRTAKTVCFVCFVLFFGTMRAQNYSTSTKDASDNKRDTSNEKSSLPPVTEQLKTDESNQVCVCPTVPTKTPERQCLLFLPEGATLTLVLGALALACFILLLTTLICACQLCSMKVMISKFQPNHNYIDLQSMRKRSESPSRDDRPAVREPTETCLMLSEVTTQEEENKEESIQTFPEPYVEGPNGEVAPESGNSCKTESKEPDVEAPESSTIEV